MFVPSPSQIRVHDLRHQELLAEAAQYRFAAAVRADRFGVLKEIAGPRFKRVLGFALATLAAVGARRRPIARTA